MNVFILACTLLSGIVPQACYIKDSQEKCFSAPTGRYEFQALPEGKYTFYCKYGTTLGDMIPNFPIPPAASPCPTPAPDFLCLECERRYEACSLSNYQMFDLITRLRKTCGRKCDKVK